MVLDAFEDETFKHFRYVLEVENGLIITRSVFIKSKFLEKWSDLC